MSENESTSVPENTPVSTPATELASDEVVAPDVPVEQAQPTTEPTVAPQVESTPEPVFKERTPQNVTIDAALSIPEPKNTRVYIALPSDTEKRLNEVTESLPNLNLAKSEQGELWLDIAKRSLAMGTIHDTFLKTLENPNADFHQTVEHNGARFGSHEAKFVEKQNSKFDGEMAVLRTMSYLGLGSTWNTGLYNTGIWITFKPPSEEDLVELYRQLTSDQIDMGRESYGLVYANTTSYTIARMARFAIQHIYRIGAKNDEIPIEEALNHIKAQDIASLLWGFACTMFPKGFSYNRACMANPEKCQITTTETLNLRKLQFVNRNALTEYQKNHMATHRGQNILTVADLKKYEAEMTKASGWRFVVNEGEKDEIAFNLRSPTINEYIETGHRWIEDMVSNVERALGSEGSIDEKNKLIDLRSRATIMRQYSHWVRSIEMGSNTIEDPKGIEDVISSISGDATIRETYLLEIKKFIENSSVAVIAIPTYDCPACGGANEGPATFPHKAALIPVDVVQLFFALLTQKHRDLQER